MITRFYKIYNKYNEVVYVGVTTRSIRRRFKEHIKAKNLNSNYYCKEFFKIIHNKINTLDDYYTERKKVVYYERLFIKTELDKGSKLLNLSKGGEWGSALLSKLLKTDFFNKKINNISFKEYFKNLKKYYRFLNNWIVHKSENKYKQFLYNFISNNIERPIYKHFLLEMTNKINIYKQFLCNWLYVKTKPRYLNLLGHWIFESNKNKLKYKKLLYRWSFMNNITLYKRFLRNWITHRSENKYKSFLNSFIRSKSYSNYKKLIYIWISNKTKNKYKVFLYIWVKNRDNRGKVCKRL